MSDEKITIEISLEDAVYYVEEYKQFAPSRPPDRVAQACKKVLDARQTKYEKWQKDRRLPWVCHRDEDAKLVAAAPQMLDELIRLRKRIGAYPDEYRGMAEAIRAALPDDVADEVLNGPSSGGCG